MTPEEENSQLRRMLAFAVGGPLLYADDGELHDSTVRPWIDFKRDPLEAIQEKLAERAQRAIDFSALARRVAGTLPAFAAPYGSTTTGRVKTEPTVQHFPPEKKP